MADQSNPQPKNEIPSMTSVDPEDNIVLSTYNTSNHQLKQQFQHTNTSNKKQQSSRSSLSAINQVSIKAPSNPSDI
jgi:biopolymer transport protein ExbD